MMAVDVSALRSALDYVDAHPGALASSELAFFRDWMAKRGCVFGALTEDDEEEEEYEPPPDVEGADEEMELARSTDGEERLSHYNRAVELDPSQSRRFAERGEYHFELQDYPSARRDADRALELKPDSVKGLRLRANVAWMENDVRLAYLTMCEAQRNDYSDEWDPLHRQMKEAFDESIAAKQASPSPSPPHAQNGGIDMNAFMQSPAVQEMAQNLMKNPALMQQMMGAFQGAQR